MASQHLAAPTVCRVLEEDPDLAEAIPSPRREAAVQECIAEAITIPPGTWEAEPFEGIGLLVLSGLLIRRVGIDGRFGAELLGEGDVLRPWESEDGVDTLPRTTGWRVLETCHVAVLDQRAAYRLAKYPELVGSLVGRALRRSRNLVVNMAIVHQPRVHVRLHMLFWHLANRWGRVRSDGIWLPLRLTHHVLADLVAAHRPTVTTALAELAHRENIHPVSEGWLLTGEPPGELLELQAVGVAP